jgi:repressor LexA
MRSLSDKSLQRYKAILKFLYEYKKKNGYPPTNREISEAAGIPSTSVTSYYLDRLKERGLVNFVPKAARTIQLTNVGSQLVQKTNPKV